MAILQVALTVREAASRTTVPFPQSKAPHLPNQDLVILSVDMNNQAAQQKVVTRPWRMKSEEDSPG